MEIKIKALKEITKARQPGNKELTDALSLVVSTKDGPHELITVRCYMSRAASASVVYACVWVHAPGFYASGSGSAGGGGYCKRSAAIGSAMSDFADMTSIDGAGMSAVEAAMHAIARKLGYKGKAIIIRH